MCCVNFAKTAFFVVVVMRNKWKDLYPDDKNQVVTFHILDYRFFFFFQLIFWMKIEGIDDDILKRASEMLEFSNADWNTIRL